MEFLENLEHFLDTYDLTLSELDSEELDESSQLDKSSDEDIIDEEPKNIMRISETDVNDLIKKLQECCLCETKYSEKILSDFLKSLVLE
ncbi:17321_t:CDS:1, partial [Racocetra fulgida]